MSLDSFQEALPAGQRDFGYIPDSQVFLPTQNSFLEARLPLYLDRVMPLDVRETLFQVLG